MTWARASRGVRIRRGWDVPTSGRPRLDIEKGNPTVELGVVIDDLPGLVPSLAVAVGDRVRAGDVLVADQRRPSVTVVAPGSGVVSAVHRGPRRRLASVVLTTEDANHDDPGVAAPRARHEIESLAAHEVRQLLMASGDWTSLRSRPFGRIADPETTPDALFVTAIDTEPLAAPPDVALSGAASDFEDGLLVLSRLVEGPIHLCVGPGSTIPRGDPRRVTTTEFAGPHPAGLVGTHIHHLHPVAPGRSVWHVGYQDVAAIGHLFRTGRRDPFRIVALTGPALEDPRLVRTRVGSKADELLRGGVREGPHRVIAGSMLSGREASGTTAFLGRCHDQITVLPDAAVAMHGTKRAMLPLESLERMVAVDVPVAALLRALLCADFETAELLGCLDLVEEDLALATYACPSKNDYGPLLRLALNAIEARR